MTPHQILVVCIRLVAIVWGLYIISHAYGVFSYLDRNASVGFSQSFYLFITSLQIAICGVLWFLPNAVARLLLPSAWAASEAEPVRMLEWQMIGVVCIGLLTLGRSIPDVVYWTTFYNMAISTGVVAEELSPEQKASFLSTIVEILIGLWLLFGARGFVAFLLRARTAGVARANNG